MYVSGTHSFQLNPRGPDGPTKHPLDQVRRTSFIRLVLVALMIGGFLAAPAASLAQPVPLSPPQLDQLVARIALYPDPLPAQVVTASTYSNQICEAATWADQHSYLKGDALAHAGMAAVSFTATSGVADLYHAVYITYLGTIGIAAVTVVVLVGALVTALVDRLQEKSVILDKLFTRSPQPVVSANSATYSIRLKVMIRAEVYRAEVAGPIRVQ